MGMLFNSEVAGGFIVNGEEVGGVMFNGMTLFELPPETAAEPMTSTPVVFTALSKFTGVFTVGGTGGQGGQWQYKASGSTGSSNTGPIGSNTLGFVHTETSGSSYSYTDFVTRGTATMKAASIQAGTSRKLHFRACLQGDFRSAGEGLTVQWRASDTDTWKAAGGIRGWEFDTDEAAVGDTPTEWSTNPIPDDQRVTALGGWCDFAIDIPDNATQIRLVPLTIGTGGGSTYRHDIALRQMYWEYTPA